MTETKEPPHSALLSFAPEHLKLIGLVTANWASLENSLINLICFMSDLDGPAAKAILLSVSSNQVRCKIIENFAVSQKFTPESLSQLKTCLKQVRACAERRNAVIHDTHGIRVGVLDVVAHKRSAKKATDEIIVMPLEALQNLADDIANCMVEVHKLPGVFHPQFISRRQKD